MTLALDADEQVLLDVVATSGAYFFVYIFTLGGWEYARRRRRWYLTNQRVLFVRALERSGAFRRPTSSRSRPTHTPSHGRALDWLDIKARIGNGRIKNRRIDYLFRSDAEAFAERLLERISEVSEAAP